MQTITFSKYGEPHTRKLTTKHVRNLRKLAAYLNQLPKNYSHFDMTQYCDTRKDSHMIDEHAPAEVASKINVCGTVACAAGHGPMAGIRAKRDEDWSEYTQRVFGVGLGSLFDWCFGYSWNTVDNTPRGAAQRITLMLDTSALPESHRDERNGDAPLSYQKVRVPKLETLGLA